MCTSNTNAQLDTSLHGILNFRKSLKSDMRHQRDTAVKLDVTTHRETNATPHGLTVNSPVTASNPTWMVCSKSEGREISGRSLFL